MHGRQIVLAGCVVAGVLCAPTTAWADRPHADTDVVTLTACDGATITQQAIFDGEKSHAMHDGTVLTTGVFKLQYTNVATHQSVVVNVSGPGTLTFGDNEVLLSVTGRSGGPDLFGGISVTAGPVAFLVHFGTPGDPDDPFSVTQVSGAIPHTWQLCPLLT